MTAAEQYIYNCYLETSRKLNNKPFKYRKDFEGFEEKEEYILVSKLSRFFAKYSNININSNNPYLKNILILILKIFLKHLTLYIMKSILT